MQVLAKSRSGHQTPWSQSLQVVISLMWVLGTKPCPLQEQYTLSCCISCLPLNFVLKLSLPQSRTGDPGAQALFDQFVPPNVATPSRFSLSHHCLFKRCVRASAEHSYWGCGSTDLCFETPVTVTVK